MLKLVRIIFLLLLTSIFICGCSHKNTIVTQFSEKDRDDFFRGCTQSGLRGGADPKYIEKFCNCAWEVQYTNMTYEEYREIANLRQQGKKTEEIPQLMKIVEKLQKCKNQ